MHGTSRLVGRTEELASLCQALGAATGGSPRFVNLVGEAGAGKSRLADELCARADLEALVVTGQCYEDAPELPYWPWASVVEQCLELCGDVEQVLGPKLAHLGAITPAAGVMQAGADDLSDSRRFLTFDAVRALVRAVATPRPLVLFLEDLHWASLSCVRLLEFVVSELGSEKLLVLATTRSGERPVDEEASRIVAELACRSGGLVIELGGLDECELGELIAGRKGLSLDGAALRAIQSETGGNPFFALEVAAALPDLVGASVPSSVREVVLRRVERLGEPCASVLCTASVFGPSFSLPALERVCQLESRTEGVLACIAEAVRAGLLVKAGVGSYAFTHALVRKALYTELGSARRAKLHRMIGEMIEARHGAHSERHVAELAHHFVQAVSVGERHRAVRYASRAGALALGRFAFEEAARHYSAALEVADLRGDTDAEERCSILVGLAEALLSQGRTERSRALFLDAVALATAIGNADLLARAATGHAGPWREAGATDDRVVALLETALAGLPDRDDALRARLMSRLAIELYWSDLEASMCLGRAALEMARRLGDPITTAGVLASTRLSLWAADNSEERYQMSRESLALAEQVGDPSLVAIARMWRVCDEVEQGRMSVAEAELTAFERLVSEAPRSLGSWQFLNQRAFVLQIQGRFDEAERMADEALEMGQAWNPEEAARFFFGQQVMLRFWRAESLEDLEDPIRLMGVELPGFIAWRAVLGFVYSTLDRHDDALAEITALADEMASLPRDWSYVPALCLAAMALPPEGAPEIARLILDRLRTHGGKFSFAGTGVAALGPVSFFLSRAAAAAGRTDEARAQLRDAVALSTQMRAAPFRALAMLELGELLLGETDGKPGEARELLETAATVFSEMGLEVRAEAARALCAQAPLGEISLEGVFRREGEGWRVGLRGRDATVRDSKGMRALAYLLAHPALPVQALELAAIADGRPVLESPGAARGGAVDPAIQMSIEGDLGAVIDDRAHDSYRERLRELDAEIADLGATADEGRVASLEEERSFLSRELARAVGRGGQRRRSGSPTERARINLTRTIKDAIDRLEADVPELASYLRGTISTGTLLCHEPDPHVLVSWHD